jgi:propanediol dehydratase large subunit
VSGQAPRRSKRFVERERRDLRRELLISPYPELGLVAMNGPNDPEPGLIVEEGRVAFLDGRPESEFDALDQFIARYGLDLDVAAEAMALDDADLARRLVDVAVEPEQLVRLARG